MHLTCLVEGKKKEMGKKPRKEMGYNLIIDVNRKGRLKVSVTSIPILLGHYRQLRVCLNSYKQLYG